MRGVDADPPIANSVRIRFDWRVRAERPFLRMLTLILKPLFRWNHNWAIQRAKEGLEPYLLGLQRKHDSHVRDIRSAT